MAKEGTRGIATLRIGVARRNRQPTRADGLVPLTASATLAKHYPCVTFVTE